MQTERCQHVSFPSKRYPNMVVAEGTIYENFVKFIPSLRPLHMERGRGQQEIFSALTRKRFVLHIGANKTLPARFISQQKIPKTWSFVRFRRKFSKKVQVQKKRPEKFFFRRRIEDRSAGANHGNFVNFFSEFETPPHGKRAWSRKKFFPR